MFENSWCQPVLRWPVSCRLFPADELAGGLASEPLARWVPSAVRIVAFGATDARDRFVAMVVLGDFMRVAKIISSMPQPLRRSRRGTAGTFAGSGRLSGGGANGRLQVRIIAMLGWALTFLIVALIAAVLGFGGIAGFAVEIAKIIFFVAIILFVISAIFGLMRGRSPTVP